MTIAESILYALSEPVFILDGTLQVTMANPAFHSALGMSESQTTGISVHELFASASGDPPLRGILEKVVAHFSEVTNIEVICTAPHSAPMTLILSARRIILGDDPSVHVLVELRDITSDRIAAQKIAQIHEALQKHYIELGVVNTNLESFTQYASHDLRTPLRLMNKIANLLLEEHGALIPESAVEKIHMILDGTQEMGRLIEDLLAFSHANRGPIRKRRIDPRRLVNEALQELRDEIESRSISVVVDDLPECQADRALLKLVYSNLLANAVKFTRRSEQAKIHVGFETTNRGSVYYVQDNGMGFEMAEADTMFQVFQRLHRSQSIEGTGVGLAIVKRIVERHGGRVWATGQPGQGATIRFMLGDTGTN